MERRKMKSFAENLHFVVARDSENAAQHAADIVCEELRRCPNLLLCAAAGSSPTRAYQLLGQAARQKPSLFEHLRIILVDEWLGLRRGDPATCEADLKNKLLDPLHIPADRYQGFRTDSADPERECERISQWLAQHGPIGRSVLGVGANGHLAMNEPAETMHSHVHVARLTPTSLEHPLLAASPIKPAHGLTLGMADLLRSKKILLLACGPHKRPVLSRLSEPHISTQFPASLLWLHPDATVLTDPTAAPDLKPGQAA
jgi:galactosamine-6-phosphate isomerase